MILTQRVGGAYVAVQPGEARNLQSVERRNQDGYLPCVYTITLEEYPAKVVWTLGEPEATVLAEKDWQPSTAAGCVLQLREATDRAALMRALLLLGVDTTDLRGVWHEMAATLAQTA